MKFAAGIILYQPTKSQLENANCLALSFDKLFLFNNSENGYLFPEVSFHSHVEIIEGNGNKGLPYGFNSIIERCDNYDFLCTLDQDSIYNGEDILRIKEKIETISKIDEIGIIAPYIDYGYGNHHPSERLEDKRWVITSGSFVNLKVLREERLCYDEAYFIDKFEIDLCEQLKRKEYRVLMYHGATLHQRLGEESGHHYPNHSELRHYYLFRNRFYFNKKWHKSYVRISLNIAQTLRHMLMILLYEDNKINKIEKFIKAYFDFKDGLMGKYGNIS